ncbi:MAG: ribosome biogenesis GTPase Der [Candidatus Hydrogenedentes bacterium]|nr:ribosome biogenesis GTPase Der [Candidatus Hydrogenedentota bacterium]
MAKRRLPLVAICGRPNVGKSTLFNRIVGKQRAIIHDEAGITRDRSYAAAEWNGRAFRVVDTGGMVDEPVDPVSRKIQAQVRTALDEAAAIIFVVDGQEEITRLDEEVRDALFKYGKPVFLAVNKLDNAKLLENRTDFFVLGLGEPYGISSTHGLGVDELLDALTERLPAHAPTPVDSDHPVTKVAIIGKPNVGKSSFINAILNEERSIVDEKPGTTRDAIDIEFSWKGKDYLLIDTAGLRRKAGIKTPVEHFSVARALRAIRRADVCLVMLDATEGVSDQDKRILNYVEESGTGLVLVWTKWDLVNDKEARYKALHDELEFHAPFIGYAPVLTISNVTRLRLFTAFEYVDRVAEAAQKRITTGELNRMIASVCAAVPPPNRKGKPPKIKYAVQAGVKPTTFVFFVNKKDLFHFSYVRYLENRLRERYRFEGVPLRLELREGKPPE